MEPTTSPEVRSFQTEVKEILDLMAHALYSHKEVFLRELLSNAADALDKRRLEEIKDPALAGEHKIRITVNPHRVLTISDTGIGMGYEEVVQNIGTIAYSGTKQLLKHLKENQKNDLPELIGQFGVGFYSVFTVAKEVRLHTQKLGEKEGVLWISRGDGTYSMERTPRVEGTGTTVTLYLKDIEEGEQDFSDPQVLQSLVKHYSDFNPYPIYMALPEDTIINSQKALWERSPQEISSREYQEFYRKFNHSFDEFEHVIHYQAQGLLQEFTALLFIPKVLLSETFRKHEMGLDLYVKKVLIQKKCKDLIPAYLRFFQGLVDAKDISLNVSREMVQKDRQVLAIQKALVSKILRYLGDLLKQDPKSYEKFWEQMGPVFKEGLMEQDGREQLAELCLFHTSAPKKWTTLAEYLEGAKEGQEHIYYLAGSSLESLKVSPYLERLKSRGLEVLLLVDRVDEWAFRALMEFRGKTLVSASQEGLDLGDPDKSEDLLKKQEEEKHNLLGKLKNFLSGKVKDVRLSQRLVDSPACLVSGDISVHMEKMIQSVSGGHKSQSLRTLEINGEHPLFAKWEKCSEGIQKIIAELLYHQALIHEGSTVEDTLAFSRLLGQVMLEVKEEESL